MSTSITAQRVRELLTVAAQTRLLVLGDVMLDQFIWGRAARHVALVREIHDRHRSLRGDARDRSEEHTSELQSR